MIASKEEIIRKDVIRRYFTAIERMKQHKKVRGLKTITDAHNINRRNIYDMKRSHNAKFDIYWFWVLIHEYGVNGDWLFTGRGEMFKVDLTVPMPAGWVGTKHRKPRQARRD